MDNIGIVIIGRNEGERLKKCISTISLEDVPVTYVDSGSTDDSVEFCRSKGMDVIKLDMSIPFSAGRARNEGARRLLQAHSDIHFIQFVDGDCALAENWITLAHEFLMGNSEVAIACGRRKELYPDVSIYNLLCDIEWNTQTGEVQACGGDFMIRTTAFESVEGFDPNMIAGEEPDLCIRLQSDGWKIFRLDHSMTWHDADIKKFSQWWKRTTRAGHAFAHNMVKHWCLKKNINVRTVCSIMLWGIGLPLVFLMGMLLDRTLLSIIATFLFVAMVLRICVKSLPKNKFNKTNSMAYGFFIMVGKTPEALGVLLFLSRWLFGRSYKILEYK